MRKSIFDIITDCSINERMDNDLLQNDEYMKIQNKISEQSAQFDKLDLTHEQRLVIDRFISSHTESGAFYGRMAYKQGFKDCVSILQEVNIIKAS